MGTETETFGFLPETFDLGLETRPRPSEAETETFFEIDPLISSDR
jgi:hypothetical protein